MLVIMVLVGMWLLVVAGVVVLCRMAQQGDLAAAMTADQAHAPAQVVSLAQRRRERVPAQLADMSRRRHAR